MGFCKWLRQFEVHETTNSPGWSNTKKNAQLYSSDALFVVLFVLVVSRLSSTRGHGPNKNQLVQLESIRYHKTSGIRKGLETVQTGTILRVIWVGSTACTVNRSCSVRHCASLLQVFQIPALNLHWRSLSWWEASCHLTETTHTCCRQKQHWGEKCMAVLHSYESWWISHLQWFSFPVKFGWRRRPKTAMDSGFQFDVLSLTGGYKKTDKALINHLSKTFLKEKGYTTFVFSIGH